MLKLQFNAPNSISVGAPLQTPLGELTALHRPYLDFRGPTSKGSDGMERGEKGRGGNEKGNGRKWR